MQATTSAAPEKIARRIKVIDADTHIMEPYDLWTSRVPKKWGHLVPHVVQYSGPDGGLLGQLRRGDDVWVMGEESSSHTESMHPVGLYALAGWTESLPGHAATLAETDPAGYDAHKRLERMDQYGIHAQVLYPNIGGFGSGRFLTLKDPALKLACVQAYNDFLAEWCAVNPNRLLAQMATPFWDVKASVAEIKRAAKAGHRGINFTHLPETFGFPHLADPHWNPIWEIAQDMELPINFHIGNGNMSDVRIPFYPGNGRQVTYSKHAIMTFMDNALGILEIIGSGICHRYPKLNFVSVESGVGWIPFILASLEWQWENGGVYKEHPEFLRPTEYFKRQIYGCFWFEDATAETTLQVLGADNFLFETDFPHPTSIAPGPNTKAKNPIDHIEDRFARYPEEWRQKVLHDNAARIYHLT